MKRRLFYFNSLLSLALLCAAPAAAQDLTLETPAVAPAELYDEVCGLISRLYYDRRVLAAKGWDQIRARHRDRVAAAIGQEELHEAINEMLAELKTSHLVLVDGKVYDRHLTAEFKNQKVPQLGAEFVEIDRKLYLAGLLEGGPAEKAGLLAGDRILTIDGLPARDHADLRHAGHDPGLPGQPGYVLLVEEGRHVHIEYQRTRGGPIQAIEVPIFKTNMIEAMSRSVRVLEMDGRKIGVIHLWHFMNEIALKIFDDAVRGPFAEVDGLILDIRGRGGSSAVVNQLLSRFSGRRRNWDRPVVVLTHGETRSAKEIFAWQWRKLKLGPIVGERTQGACIGTTFHQLKDGSSILMPRTGVTRLSGGVDLEGRGVDPTIPQDEWPLPFRAGADRILQRGLQELRGLLPEEAMPAPAPKGRLFFLRAA